MSNYKGQLEGFPSEVVEKMLERQVEQGNKRDVGVFEKNKSAGPLAGFSWCKTAEEYIFWSEVIENKDFALFFSRYPKKDKFTPISEETGKKLVEAMEKLRLGYMMKEIDSLVNFTSSSNMGELTLSSKWQPKEGDVVVIESPRGKTISIFKSGEIGMGDIWSFYAALHYADGFLVDELIWDIYGDAKIRPATYKERCTFFSRLVNEGYKWNAKKLKLTKWVPKDGDFLYWENKTSGGYGICILEGQYLGSGEVLLNYVHLASNNTLRYTQFIGKKDRMDRPATNSERQQLLDALRKEGKRWNAELKRVEDIGQEYKEGDFVICSTENKIPFIGIIKKEIDRSTYCYYWCRYTNGNTGTNILVSECDSIRLVTNNERVEFLSALAKDGKKWNAEKKCIEDIKPTYSIGDIVLTNDGSIAIVSKINEHDTYGVFVVLLSNGELHINNNSVVMTFTSNFIKRKANKQEVSKLNEALAKAGYRRSAKMGVIEPLKWRPKRNEMYYFVELNSINLYSCATWEDDEFDNTCYNHGIIFRTEEEAISCAKKMLEK